MTAELHAALGSARHAQLVWFDPGVTTGIFVCSVRPSWLGGNGEPTWLGLRKALTMTWFGQVGRLPRIWSEDTDRAKVPGDGHTAMRRGKGGNGLGAGVGTILSGRGRYGGGPVSEHLRNETEQVIQCQALLDLWADAAWGYEDFVPGSANQSREFLAPVRIFARLEASEIVYGERGRVPFVQSPAMAKTTATDERMKAAGLYRPGLPHATDAARHAATFLRRARGDAALSHAAWPRIFKSAVEVA